jgi:hypothetical protein
MQLWSDGTPAPSILSPGPNGSQTCVTRTQTIHIGRIEDSIFLLLSFFTGHDFGVKMIGRFSEWVLAPLLYIDQEQKLDNSQWSLSYANLTK